MRKAIYVFAVLFVFTNLFAGLKDDFSETFKNLQSKADLVSTEKEMLDFKKKVKAEYLRLIEKNKNSLTDEEKIFAARMYIELGEGEKALALLKKVKVNKENSNYYYSTSGQANFISGQYEKSLSSFEKANISQPRVALDYVNVGFGLIKKGKYALAEKVFEKILGIEGMNLNVKYFAAIGLMENAQFNNNISEAKSVLKKTAQKAVNADEKRLLERIVSQLDLVGKQAFEIKNPKMTFNGKEIQLKKFKGKYVLIFFFAGRSRGSVKAMPYVDGIYRHYSKKIEVVGINLFPKNVDEKKQKDFFTWYIKQNKKIAYPVVIVGDDTTYKDYGVYTLPHFVLINPKGKIDKIFVGFPNEYFNPMLGYLEQIGGNAKK